MDGLWAGLRKGAGLQKALRLAGSVFKRYSAVPLGALLLAWPAVYNRFPLIYPDSMTYLERGRSLARAVLLRQFSTYYGFRSPLYTLTIFPLHWNVTAWPIVAAQCLAAAWVLRLLARIASPASGARGYLALMLFLSLLTSLSWYADFIMPDVLGPLAYLALMLLAWHRHELSPGERAGLVLVGWWGITAHSSHLLLAAGLVALLGLLACCEPKRFLVRLRGVGWAAGVVALAVASQVALNTYLNGKPSLTGPRPPYLTARILADGPGKQYLESHCGQEHWTVCGRTSGVTDNPDTFLWGSDAPYENATDADARRMESEEAAFVRATLKAYPRQELAHAEENFRRQLLAFGLYGFDANDWTSTEFAETMPAAQASYEQSREAHDGLPLDLLTEIQFWTVMASLAASAILLPLAWRRGKRWMVELGVCVLVLVVANAAITGVLSTVDDRYGCRVIWMVPLLAALLGMNSLERFRTPSLRRG